MDNWQVYSLYLVPQHPISHRWRICELSHIEAMVCTTNNMTWYSMCRGFLFYSFINILIWMGRCVHLHACMWRVYPIFYLMMWCTRGSCHNAPSHRQGFSQCTMEQHSLQCTHQLECYLYNLDQRRPCMVWVYWTWKHYEKLMNLGHWWLIIYM